MPDYQYCAMLSNLGANSSLGMGLQSCSGAVSESSICSFIPRPQWPPVFDCHYSVCKYKGGRLQVNRREWHIVSGVPWRPFFVKWLSIATYVSFFSWHYRLRLIQCSYLGFAGLRAWLVTHDHPPYLCCSAKHSLCIFVKVPSKSI